MIESLKLFESIVTSRWFLKSSIVLFLNKKDLFEEMLKTDLKPFAEVFPEYIGESLYAHPRLDRDQVETVMPSVWTTSRRNL